MAGYEGWASAHRGISAGDGTRADLALSLADALRDILLSEHEPDRGLRVDVRSRGVARALRPAFLARGR